MVTSTWQTAGNVSITVIARAISAPCPHCHRDSDQIHDCRPRCKRDVPLRDHRVWVIVLKRRFRCRSCRSMFTEPDVACGRRRRTTHRLREAIGTQATSRPIAEVAQTFGTGPRFGQDFLEQVARPMRGLSVFPPLNYSKG